jgi:hypothetical protein
MPRAGHTAITVPAEVHARVAQVALHRGPEVGRRLSLSEVVAAALTVAELHPEQFLETLRTPPRKSA